MSTRTVLRLGPPLAVLVLLGAASLAYRRVFPLGAVVVAGLPAVVLPFLAVLGARRRPVLVRLLAGLLATLVVAVAVAAVAAQPPAYTQAPGAVGEALISGWSRILTTTLPAAATPDRLVVVSLTTGVATVLAALAVTASRPALPAAPALLLLAGALLLGVGGPGSVAVVTVPVAAAVLLLLLSVAAASHPVRLDRDLSLPAPRAATVLAALLLGALSLGVGAAVGPALPSRPQPVDLRQVVVPPVAVTVAADPLAVLSRRLGTESGEPMFTARFSRGSADAELPWRLSTFDTYDGIGWSSSAPAAATGTTLTSGTPEHHADVVVAGLDSIWVPTVGNAIAAEPANLRFDEQSGALLDPVPLAPGRRYRLGYALPTRDPAIVASAPVGTSTPALTETVCLPQALEELAERVRQSADAPASQAQALVKGIAALPDLVHSVDSAPGSSCGRVAALLSSADKRGTSEQFATAFALAARHLGLPTRLAVGFRPWGTSPTGTVLVTGADAYAWPEVLLGDGLGWVPFDPTPALAGDARPPLQTVEFDEVPPSGAGASAPPAQDDLAAPVSPASSRKRGRYLVPVAVLLSLVLLVPLMAVLALKTARRRERRHRKDPRHAVLGAWHELHDRLEEARLLPGPSTATAVATALAARSPLLTRPALDLADLVNRAVYDPQPLVGADARAAWSAYDELVQRLRADQRVLRGLRQRLSPRPLRRRRQAAAGSWSPFRQRAGPGSSTSSPTTASNRKQ